MPARQLSSVALTILAFADSSCARDLLRELKDMKNELQDLPIHTNTQACVPQEEQSPGVQVYIAFVIGMFVVLFMWCVVSQCKQSDSQAEKKREEQVIDTALELDETVNTSREDSIEMVEQKKKVRFADQESKATKEERASLVNSDSLATEEDSHAQERIEDLERQLKSQARDLKEKNEALEDMQFMIEELQEKNGSLKDENEVLKESNEKLEDQNAQMEAELKETKKFHKQIARENAQLTNQVEKLKKAQAKATTSDNLIQLADTPSFKTEADSFTPKAGENGKAEKEKEKKKSKKDKKKEKETASSSNQEEAKDSPKEQKEVAKHEQPVKKIEKPRVDTREMVNDLRSATANFKAVERSETRYNPKWGSSPAIRHNVIGAFGNENNETFDDICQEVVGKSLAGATKAGWTGKFTFVSAILPKADFNFDEKYKKWWYYEFDLDEKYTFVFIKADHDRVAEAKIAGPIIEEIRNQDQLGFALCALNHDYEA